MFDIFLLGALLLVHKELKRGVRKFSIEQYAKEVVRVLVRVLVIVINASEHVDEEGGESHVCVALLIDAVQWRFVCHLFFVLLESLVLGSFRLLHFFGDLLLTFYWILCGNVLRLVLATALRMRLLRLALGGQASR